MPEQAGPDLPGARTVRHTWSRRALAGAAAGALAGLLVLGGVGRLAMSVTALLAGLRLRWSFGGTAEVLAFGLLVGAAAGAPYGLLRGCRPRAPLLAGAFWGVAPFLVLLLVPPQAARSAFEGVRHVGLAAVAALFGSVFVAYGFALEWLVRRWVRSPQPISATSPIFPRT